MTMITPSYLGETIEYSSLHACRSTLEDPTYLPGGSSATMAVIDISASGKPTVLSTVTTARGSHCVTVDDINNAYVCDPRNGQLLIFHDSVPNRP